MENYDAENARLAAEIVEKLSRYVNQGRPTRYIVEAMDRDHRTLQQRMTEVMLQWFVHLANLKHYDPRNEKSVQVAKAILPVLDAQNVVIDRKGAKEAYLPLI